ncbi:hypothetical protein [Agromyces cerinus]|uniref:Uncharacterized protein n=1 Tax=Agromyces cerinus subsp. cerinus TaxID=232089 RepID=A0A1N6GFL3_9MICO|nr:hypothetical protein [Agromyces cerinus]SIO06325.1 hypothetical protein SAMN05443544_2537 [Agromyces cerinus subsp. cerinus]
MTDVDDRSGADFPVLDAAAADATADAAARISRLQRLAFGADAPEAERYAAAAELERLRRAAADAAADAAATRDELAAVATGLAAGPAHDERPEDGSDPSTAVAPPAPSTDARGIRWAIAAGAVALVLGLGIGWQLGARSEIAPRETASTAVPEAPAATAVPATTVQLAETSMPGALARPAVESDALDPAWERTYGIDLSSARRLLSLPDGLTVVGALRDGDVCLIASYAPGDGAPACSTYGIVNSEGLRTAVTSETTAMTVRWRTDGTVELSPAAADDDAGSAK